MAWINRPSASLTYVLRDQTGSRATLSFDVPYDTLAAVALTAADTLQPFIRALTGCAIESYSLAYSKFDDAPPPAAADSRVERKGVFTFRTATGKTVTYQVPGIADAVVAPTGQLTGAAVTAFATAITAVDAVFCDSSGDDIRSLKSAYERYRRSTRAMLPSERTPS